MIAQVRAELFKVRSTRTTVGLLLGMVALILLFVLLSGLLTNATSLSTMEDQRQLLSIGRPCRRLLGARGRASGDQ